MLHHAQKPLTFWAEAISTACYVRNRSPTAFLKNVTPYKHWYGKKPDVSNLKVFGCKAYVHVPDAKRKDKFDKKSIPCVFVGYSSNDNGFKFYNPQTKQMFRSRDVIFTERNFNIEKSECTDTSFEFFTGSIGKVENDVAENDIAENPQVAENEDVAERPRRARRPPDRLNALTGDWWNLIGAASVAIVDEEEPATIKKL